MPKGLGVNGPPMGIRIGGPDITERMPKALGINRPPMGIRMGGPEHHRRDVKRRKVYIRT